MSSSWAYVLVGIIVAAALVVVVHKSMRRDPVILDTQRRAFKFAAETFDPVAQTTAPAEEHDSDVGQKVADSDELSKAAGVTPGPDNAIADNTETKPFSETEAYEGYEYASL